MQRDLATAYQRTRRLTEELSVGWGSGMGKEMSQIAWSTRDGWFDLLDTD